MQSFTQVTDKRPAGKLPQVVMRLQIWLNQQGFQFLRIVRHIYVAQFLHLPGGGKLVLVAVFAKCGNAREDDDRLALAKG